MTFNSLLSVGEMVVRKVQRRIKWQDLPYKESTWLKWKQGVRAYFTKLTSENMAKEKKDMNILAC